MKTGRTVALGLSVIMAASVMAGCGGSGSTTDQKGEAKAEASAEPVVLHWWGSFAENMGPEQVCEAFNKIDPNLQVEYTRYVNDDAGNTKLDMTLMSDTSIDVFFSMNDVLLKKRIDSGYTYPLDELFDSAGFKLDEDYEDTISQKEINGHYYSLPAKRITETILYNQQMFDEAGVPYPSKDWTYDEFLDTARKLTKGEGNDKVYGWFFPGYDAGQPALRMLNSKLGVDWMYAPDGKSAFIDTEDVKDITEKYLQRVSEGIEPSYVDVTTQKMAPASMLLTGKAAMIFGDWVVRDVKDTANYPHDFKVGFAPMPRLSADQEHNYTTSYTDDLSVNSKSEHPQEAMKFIKWYIEEGMDYVAPYARIPACKKYDADKVASLIFGDQQELFDMESAKDVYLAGSDVSIRKNMTAATEINTILTEEFDKVFAGAQSVEDTLKIAQKRADEKIAQEQ